MQLELSSEGCVETGQVENGGRKAGVKMRMCAWNGDFEAQNGVGVGVHHGK